MMRSLYAAISGLRNHQVKMDVIGNNIANVNTAGFKSGSVNFQDMLSQTLAGASSGNGTTGGTNPMQVGLGVSTADISTNFTDGSTQSTGIQTDLAITGQGFFVLGDALNQVYSRAGHFTFDASGNLVVPGTGMKVLGWQGDSSGVVDTTSPIQGITIPVGSSMPAKVSSTLTMAGNLSASAIAIGTPAQRAAAALLKSNADAAKVLADTDLTTKEGALSTATTALTPTAAASVAAKAALAADPTNPTLIAADAAATAALVAGDAALISTYDAAKLAVTGAAAAVATANNDVKTADDAVAAANNKTSDQPGSLNVYDTQGNAYKLNGTFEKTGANVWSFTPAATVTDANGVVVANVTTTAPISITFNASGVFQASTASTITINPAGGPYSGAGAFTITPDFSTMTQYGTDTTAKMDSTDGYTAGTLTAGGGITIGSDGTIVGTFTNGKKMNLAKVAIATFNNPGGLMKEGDSLYAASSNSGTPNVGTSGTGGRGTLTPGSLEMSNVDLAQEFSNMIVTQRGFQANSKVITTTDSMLEELVNLKR